MTTTLKTCFKCQQCKPLSDFYKHSRMADGHLNKCKECAKRDTHESRHFKHRERVLAYDLERAKQPHRKAAMAQRLAEYSSQFPKRRNAQGKLRRAVLAGKIQPLPCFVCGEKAEAHHPDYDRPLDVMWLCSSHHKQTHALVLEP